MSASKKDTKKMVQIAVLMAITIIMGVTPLGTIRTPFMSVSLVTIPVSIAAILTGVVGGAMCGATFGITSFINAITGTSGMMTILFGVSPVGVVVTTIVPRVLEGIFVALLFKLFREKLHMKSFANYLASLCCPLLNTIMFMTCVCLFFYKSDYITGLVEKFGATNPFAFVILLVGIQGLVEAITCTIVGGVVTQTLEKVLKKN